tara:strand:- start:24 stop:818 length:795 start_codon:yes stop_codon:yes gene_type:complete
MNNKTNKEIEAGDIVVVIMTNAQLKEIGLDFTTNMGQQFEVLDVSNDKQKICIYWGWITIKAFRLMNKNKWSIYNNTTKWCELGDNQKNSLLLAAYNGHKFRVNNPKHNLFFKPKFDSPDGVYTAAIKNSDKMHNVIKPDEDLLKKYKDVQRVLLTDIEHYKSVCASKDKDINTLYKKLLAEEKENLKLRKPAQPKHLISKGKNNSHADSTARELIDRNAELERVIKLVHYDLLLRAEEDSDGVKVVDVGSSVWASLKGAIGLA